MFIGTRFIQNEAEKQTRALELGWPEGYEVAIRDLYELEELSLRKVARYFDVTEFSIGYRLRRMPGLKLRGKGGPNSFKARKRYNSLQHERELKRMSQSPFEWARGF